MRERGSSTARPTEKGIGGLPIVSRFGRFGRDLQTSSRRFGRFRRIDSVDSVAIRSIWSAACVVIRSISARRFGRVPSIWSAACVAIRSIWSAACVAIRSISAHRFGRFGRDLQTSSRRFVPTIEATPKTRRKHKKSPIPQSENRAQLSQGVARS